MNTWVPIMALVSEATLSAGGSGLTGAPDLFGSAVRMVSALAITLAILFFVFYFLRRSFSRRGGALGSRGLIRVISTAYLGGKRSLILADVAGEKLILGLSPQAISLLGKVDSPEALKKISTAEQGGQGGRPFLWYLETLMARHSNKREDSNVKQ